MRGQSGRTILWNCFDDDVMIGRALIGDYVLRDICTDGMCAYSILGGIVEVVLTPYVQKHLFCYKKVILGSIDGNNITNHSGKGAENPDVRKNKVFWSAS